MNPLTETRTRVAEALSGLTVPVFDQPPTGPLTPPCVVINPGGPWVAHRGHVTLEIVAHANTAAGNEHGLNRLEETVYEIREALFAAGLPVGDTDQPTVNETGQVSTRTPITVRTTCR
jgi:hypothetical protein